MSDHDSTPNSINGSEDFIDMETWTLQTNGLIIHYDGEEVRYADISDRVDDDWDIAEEGLVVMKTEDAMNLTPNEELRALAEEMRENAAGREYDEPMQDELAAIEEYWAGELEELIENGDG